MGLGKREQREISWDEVQQHCNVSKDKWVVIDNGVYDVTEWQNRHPGGKRLLDHYSGQDATDAFTAFHPDKKVVSKYLKPLCIGHIPRGQHKETAIERDMRDLRHRAEGMGLFESNLWFYAAQLGHIIALDLLGWACLWWYGTGWVPYLLATALLTTAQAQAIWLQHDFGHLSVFKKSRWNHWLHYFVIGGLKAASAHWWNFRHFQHHAKPNVIEKDPDLFIDSPFLFVLGEKLPKLWGRNHKGLSWPYNYQSNYFFLIVPPLLFPILWPIEIMVHIFSRKVWTDIAWTVFYFTRLYVMYSPILGAFTAFKLYMLVRFLESHWFMLISQMNHIPMKVDTDNNNDWFTSQLISTCNLKQSAFNDWLTGHLNFQIEHHLFPTMPRHNYWKIAPYVKEICDKHGIEYMNKGLATALGDLYRSLEHSGKLWYDAYHEVP